MTLKTEQIAEQDLIRHAAGGDGDAFQALVKRHYQEVYRTAIYFLRERDLALDVSQEVFIRVYGHLKSFDQSRSFTAWLYHINRNICRNAIRRKKKAITLFSDLGPITQSNGFWDSGAQVADQEIERNEERQMLWQAIGKLGTKEQEALLLKDIEQYSYAEIAGILEIPLGTVMSRLYHARKKLAALLSKTGAKGGRE